MIKLGNTSFHEEAIKKMTLKEFKDTYKELLKGVDLEDAYREISGKAKKE